MISTIAYLESTALYQKYNTTCPDAIAASSCCPRAANEFTPSKLPYTQLDALQEAGNGKRRDLPGWAYDDRQRPAPRAAERRGQCTQGHNGLAPAVQRLPGKVRVGTNAIS